MGNSPSAEEIALAEELLRLWEEGRGVSKSQLELKFWGDGTSHGRRFDRFIRSNLGIETTRRSRQTDRIADLERQVRHLGGMPIGSQPTEWEGQLHHTREAAVEALRVWNDPVCTFRTGAFSLLFVTAWNSLAIAVLQKAGAEWRKLDEDQQPIVVDGAEQARDTLALLREAFPTDAHRGLRENVAVWLDLRNSVAHRHLPELDISVIPWAQAGLLNLESVLADTFGSEYALSHRLSVPLQLSGFRDPGVVAARRTALSRLPLEVQGVLSRAESAPDEVLADPTYQMRVAFVPVVPASGRNPDAVAYFVKPGEVPEELGEAIEQYVVLAKPMSRNGLSATQVLEAVERRTGFRFHSGLHAAVARNLGAWPADGPADHTVNIGYAEFITSFKRYLYSQAWIDRLVAELGDATAFEALTGRSPRIVESESPGGAGL